MRTNIEIDDSKLSELMKIGNYKTKKEAVDMSIEANLKAIKKRELANMFGKIKWEGNLEEWRKSRFPDWDASGI